MERDHLEALGVGGIVFKLMDEKCDGLDLALDRDRCHALVNAVMNLRVP